MCQLGFGNFLQSFKALGLNSEETRRNKGNFPYFMKPCAIPGESAFMPGIARDIAHHYATLKKMNTESVPGFLGPLLRFGLYAIFS